MDNGPSWSTVESDPGVFTELIEKMGVTGVQVEELWATDFASLMQLSPVYGLVFLFKYVSEVDDRAVSEDCVGTVFFANQVIPNACATQAILSILLNIPAQPGVSGAVQLGAELEQFREFTASLPPDMKGLAIGNSEVIRSVHNSFARPEAIVPDEDIKAGKDDDAFHFIAYLPVQGTLYELDGLKRGPIALATGISCEADWLRAVGPHIAQRMERYAAGEVRFNLLAVCGDRRALLQQQLNEARGQLAALHAAAAPTPAAAAAAAAAAADSSMSVDSTPTLHDARLAAAAATTATAAIAASEAGATAVTGATAAVAAAATEATEAAAAAALRSKSEAVEAAMTAGSVRREVEEAAGRLEQLHQLEAQVACLSDALATEEAKRRRWHDENIRRRHNYVPLMFNMLQALARAGQLGGFIEAAKNPATKRARPQQQ